MTRSRSIAPQAAPRHRAPKGWEAPARPGRWPEVCRWAGRLASVVFVLIWFIALRPPALGGPATMLIVRGNSMEPTLHSGDLVIVHRASTYEPGEVVAFRVPREGAGAGSLVIHRIVGGNGAIGYATQGDGSPAPDVWLPTDADVLGATRWHIPAVGRIGNLLRSTAGIAALTGIVTGALVYSGSSPNPARDSTARARRRPSQVLRPALRPLLAPHRGRCFVGRGGNCRSAGHTCILIEQRDSQLPTSLL